MPTFTFEEATEPQTFTFEEVTAPESFSFEDVQQRTPVPSFSSPPPVSFSPGRESPDLGLYEPRVPNVNPLTGEKIYAKPTQSLLAALTTGLPLRPFSIGQQLESIAKGQDFGGGVKSEGIPALRIPAGIVKGGENVATGAMQFMTSPAGIATLGLSAAPAVVRSLASAGFAADMARHAPDAYQKFEEARLAGDDMGQAEALTEGLGTLAMAGLAGSHSYATAREVILNNRAKPAPPPETAPPATERAAATIPERETTTTPQQQGAAPTEVPVVPETVATTGPATAGPVRSAIASDRLDWFAKTGKEPTVLTIRPDEVGDLPKLGRLLTDNAATRGLNESETKRVTALEDTETGEVHIVSTYRERSTGIVRLVRPDKVGSKRPNVALEKLPDRYVVLDSFLLTEPVKNLHETFPDRASYDAAKEQLSEARQAQESLRASGEQLAEQTQTTEPVMPREAITDEGARGIHGIFGGVRTFDEVQARFDEMRTTAPALVRSELRQAAEKLMEEDPSLTPHDAVVKLQEWLYENARPEIDLQEFVRRATGFGKPRGEVARAEAAPETTARSVEEGSVGPGAASINDPAFQRPASRFDFGEWGRSVIQGVVDAFRTKARQQLPPLPSTSRQVLPDLGNRAHNKVIASEPTGVGRVPLLGWLLDPRQRARSPEEIAILTWFHENAVGQAHAQALGATFGTRFKKLFPRNERGEFSDVGPTRGGQSLHPSDVFEGLQRDPNSYVLSPEQRTAFNELMSYEMRARELAKKYRIRFDEGSEEFVAGAEGNQPYWTRGKPIKPGAEKRGPGGAMLGSKQFFQKGRSFRTEEAGVEKGFEYPLNVDDRLLLRIGRLYKAIADRRLAQDKDLGGRWGGEPKYEEGQVFQPAFRRSFTVETPEGTQSVQQFKIFPLRTANKLNKAFGPQATTLRRAVVTANNFLKSLALGFDFGVAQIQGLATAYKNPGVWARSNAEAFKAFLSRDVFAQYARNNAEAIRELAQYGSGVGRLPEMMAGLESGELLSAGPRALGKAIERTGAERLGRAVGATAEVPAAFARQFQTFMDVAKVELWKARREVVPKEEWAREIQAIESQLSSGRMEGIGVTHGQALAERVLLLAPSYYRGGLNLIAGLAERGASAQTYRRAMGAYILGSTATFVGLALAAGLSWNEIRRRLNPASGQFLMVPVTIGGRKVNVGLGGIVRSFIRLAGDVAETTVDHPEEWKSLAPDKNPFVRWLRGHSAPVPSKAWDAFSGKDYMGEKSDIGSLGKGMLPLAAQDLFDKERETRTPGQVAADFAAQSVGITTFPDRTAKQKLRNAYNTWALKHSDAKVREDTKNAMARAKAFAQVEDTKYRAIDRAIEKRDKAMIRKAYLALVRAGNSERDVWDRFSPVAASGRERTLFNESEELESQFFGSLKPEQRRLYGEAMRDWYRRFGLFQDATGIFRRPRD